MTVKKSHQGLGGLSRYIKKLIKNRVSPTYFVIIFMVLGVTALILSRAVTGSVNFASESETSQVVGVQRQSDVNASGGNYIQFGTTNSFSLAKTLVNDNGNSVLFWDQSTLPGITSYEIWRDGDKVGTIPASQVSQNLVGGNVGAGVVGIANLSDTENAATTLTNMKNAGFGWTRIDMNWWTAESTQNIFDWRFFDTAMARATVAGQKIAGLIAYTPPWAGTNGAPVTPTNPLGKFYDHAPPANMQDYSDYAAALVKRYGPASKYGPGCNCANPVRVWEIWNEQNTAGFWKDSYTNQNPNPTNYANMLRAVYPVIKDIDPGATVITGGLSPAPDLTIGQPNLSPATFLQALYQQINIKGFFDAVALHPYSGGYPPTYLPPEGVNANAYLVTRSLAGIMSTNGDSAKKIWATESGWPTVSACGSFSKTEQEQSDYAVESIYNWYQFAVNGPNIFYVYKDYPQTTASGQCDPYINYGFTTLTGANKLAVPALTKVNKQLVFIDSTVPTAGTFTYQIKAVGASGQTAVTNIATITKN